MSTNLLLAQAAGTAADTRNDSLLILAFVLLAASIGLLVLELFIPSGGLIGMLAGIAVIGSLVAFFAYDTTWGVVASLAYVVMGPVVGMTVFKWWMNSPLARRLVLGGGDDAQDDSVDEAGQPMSAEHARQERLSALRQLIGARGVAATPLRPVGVVRINGQRIDALAESGVIDAGTAIVVTEVHDNQVKVRADDTAANAPRA